MQVLEQKLLRVSHQASGLTESLADLLSLQHVVQRLTDQVTLLESQNSDLKFSVTTNVQAKAIKLEICVADIKKIEEHILFWKRKC